MNNVYIISQLFTLFHAAYTLPNAYQLIENVVENCLGIGAVLDFVANSQNIARIRYIVIDLIIRTLVGKLSQFRLLRSELFIQIK